jgi:hypothetical protein
MKGYFIKNIENNSIINYNLKNFSKDSEIIGCDNYY